MPLAPWAFDSRVTIQHVSRSYDGLNATETWTDLQTVWCCVSQATQSKRIRPDLAEGERLTQNISYKLLFQERFLDIFNDPKFFADYQFLWTDEGRTLRPTTTAVSPGKKSANYSFIYVEDVTGLNG